MFCFLSLFCIVFVFQLIASIKVRIWKICDYSVKQERRSEASKIASERILETTERFTQGHPMDRFGGISVRRTCKLPQIFG